MELNFEHNLVIVWLIETAARRVAITAKDEAEGHKWGDGVDSLEQRPGHRSGR